MKQSQLMILLLLMGSSTQPAFDWELYTRCSKIGLPVVAALMAVGWVQWQRFYNKYQRKDAEYTQVRINSDAQIKRLEGQNKDLEKLNKDLEKQRDGYLGLCELVNVVQEDDGTLKINPKRRAIIGRGIVFEPRNKEKLQGPRLALIFEDSAEDLIVKLYLREPDKLKSFIIIEKNSIALDAELVPLFGVDKRINVKDGENLLNNRIKLI